MRKIIVLIVLSFVIAGCSNETQREKMRKAKKDVQSNQIREAISKSNDYNKYKKAFFLITKKLISEGKCSLEEIKEFGGWMYAPVQSKKMGGKPHYFIYCGGMKQHNKIYIDPINFNYK